MATATLISYPSALCLAGNIEPVRVSAAGLFTFRLKKGSTVLLEEDYMPDSSGQAEIDIRGIILSDLSLSLPSSDVYKQASAAGSYTITTDTDSKTFKAVLGGIERPATDAVTFLQANFLTWQPQIKSVTYDQPEWLSFYTPATAIALKAKFYLKDGTTDTVTVAGSTSFDAGCIYSVNVQFARLWNMGEGDRYGMVDVWLEDDQGAALTYVQRYVLDTSGDERTVLVARNSLGGIDTFSFRGGMERAAEVEHTNVMRGETMYSGLIDLTRTYTVNTGILSRHERDWVWDLQRSPQAWALMDGALLPVVMLTPAVTASMYEDSTGTVDFYISDDSGYLNIPRIDTMPADIEIPGPDGEVFFLAPRLIDFQDAVLDQSLLIPVQSPLLQEWRKMSVGGLSSYILSLVDDKYESSIHVHDNLEVLSKLSVDDNGKLMFDGGLVGGGSGLAEHDHHGETIRPEKIIVGDVEITCVDGRLHISKGLVSDGDIAAFGAEEGEEGGSGGLDIARLWEELAAEDSSKVIDVSHIPGSVVLQDELIEVLDDYPLTTEMNEALAGKADKDWVEGELGKYLPLTGGKISGDLEVTGTLKIGEAVLSYQDGRLRISKGVVSDGDLAAFSAEEGEEGGSGGLDIARLWEELEAEDSSKVIDVSHIPGSVVLQDELTEILDDYPLTTEMNEALAGKAGKDWVEEELAKYLLLTGGKISGDLEVTGTLKIGEAVLSHQDGRLHISKGVVSDGDLAAFSAEEGEEGGSGGLDIARLWEELEAEDSSKVIDVSHIPGSVVLQDELVEILDDYPLTTEMNEALAGKAGLQHTHAISEVTGLQSALNSKWEWNASQVAGVKVSNAFAADKLASSVKINGTDFNGESDIVTTSWGKSRTITVWDFYNVNKQAAQGIDGSADFSLMLPQSIKVKTLNIDGVTLSVVGGRLHVDSTLTADGDLVAYGDGEGSSGGGLDEEAMWAALGGSMSSKVVSASHLPSLSSLSGNLDSSRITGLDSALTSYAKKDGSNATGTWPVSISGNAASATWARYITPRQFGNQGTIGALKSSVLSAMGDGNLLMYPGQSYITSGSHVSTIMNNWSNDGFSIPAGSQTVLLRLDNYQSSTYGVFLVSGYSGGFYRLLRNDSSTWKGPYILLDAENYHNITDSRYVKKAGDTMTGPLQFPDNVVANGQPTIKFGSLGQVGCDAAYGSWIQYRNNYIHITDGGPRYNNTYTIWHSGNDGSGSGLDADLLDGQHASYWQRRATGFNFITNYDLNVAYASGSVSYNYTSGSNWVNGPSGMSYGIVLPIMAESGYSIAAQLAFDINHGTAAATGSMWFRGRNTSGWGTNWKKVLTDSDNIYTSGKLFIPSSEGNQKYYIRIE